MAYDLHIHRKNDWTDKEGPMVSEEEWTQLINDDPELELDINILKGIPSGVWKHSKTGNPIPFYFHQGEVDVSGADEDILAKAKDIALKLGAKVQGDEGEFYEK